MEWLLQRWSSQACLIHGRRLREPIPAGKSAGQLLLMRWVDLEYSADDGGDIPPRYMPGVMPLRPQLDAMEGNLEYVLGTLELSATQDEGKNAFGRFDPYPSELLLRQEREFASLAQLFDEELAALSLDTGPAWHLVAGGAGGAELLFGAMVAPNSVGDLPEGVLHLARGRGPGAALHPRVAVGALVARVSAPERWALVDPHALRPERYTTQLRVIRTYWPHAKTGFVVVPTARPTDRPSATEPTP